MDDFSQFRRMNRGERFSLVQRAKDLVAAGFQFRAESTMHPLVLCHPDGTPVPEPVADELLFPAAAVSR